MKGGKRAPRGELERIALARAHYETRTKRRRKWKRWRETTCR